MTPHLSHRRDFRGFTWIELLIVVLIIAGGAYLTMPACNFDQPDRSKVSRVRADFRTLATAIESYYVDWKAYPAERPLRLAVSSDADLVELRREGGWGLSTVEWGRGENLQGLTTPIAYLSSPFPDPFSKIKRLPYAYYATGDGWILISPGPDGHYDITNPAAVYDDSDEGPRPSLINLTYDSTNGATSGGDIYRLKQ